MQGNPYAYGNPYGFVDYGFIRVGLLTSAAQDCAHWKGEYAKAKKFKNKKKRVRKMAEAKAKYERACRIAELKVKKKEQKVQAADPNAGLPGITDSSVQDIIAAGGAAGEAAVAPVAAPNYTLPLVVAGIMGVIAVALVAFTGKPKKKSTTKAKSASTPARQLPAARPAAA